jgi:hypothetical protein
MVIVIGKYFGARSWEEEIIFLKIITPKGYS